MNHAKYRGRLAPSPTGYLHLGHARTFWVAQERARAQGGKLILRNEDLDSTRFKMEFADAMPEDLRWFGFEWSEGPDVGGKFAPYNQSERMDIYRAALEKFTPATSFIPAPVRAGTSKLRRARRTRTTRTSRFIPERAVKIADPKSPIVNSVGVSAFPTAKPFRSPTEISANKHLSREKILAISWCGAAMACRRISSRVSVDDAAMQITEVVRGGDLLVSTARQMLLYRALHCPVPDFYHCPLMLDEKGVRLAKRHDALSLRQLRERGESPENLRRGWVTKD